MITKLLSVKSTQNKIIQAVRNRLENQGVDSDIKKLQTDRAKQQNQKFYSKRTQQIKRDKGQRIDHVTLKDSGKFHDDIKIELTENSLEITSDFEKANGNIYENFQQSYDSEKEFEQKILDLDFNEKQELIYEIQEILTIELQKVFS